MSHNRKILIVKLSALGDVIQALPVAMAIKRAWPDAGVDWLVEKPASGVLIGHPALSRILVSPRQAIKANPLSVFSEIGSFIRELRSVRYHAVLDLQGLMKSAMLVALSRAERKIGFAGGKEPVAAWPLNERLAPYDPDRHALERYLDILEPLGVMRPARPEYGLEPEAGELAQADEFVAGFGGGRPLALLHPMAKWESKLWPEGHWARVASLLVDGGLAPVLSGSKADAEVTDRICQLSGLGGGILDLAGQTSLKTLAALITKVKVVVSTDTGVMHLAAAMGAPVVSLFGPTAPWRTGPHGVINRALRLGQECSPCFSRSCPEPRCLTELSPAEVAKAALEAAGGRT